MEKEMNFWDLCRACWGAILSGCRAVCGWLAALCRLTYRKWWIVLPVLALAIAAACYYSRQDNLIYKVRAVALLNGPSIEQFEQRFAPFRSGLNFGDAEVASYVTDFVARDFRTFRVIDVYADSVADYIDLKEKSVPTDTVNVQMQDRLCVQFRMKSRDLHLLSDLEHKMLTYLNADQAMQTAYAAYKPDLDRRVRFNHEQLEKLDSLTSQYYFHSTPGASLTAISNGMILSGDRRVYIFLEPIYRQQLLTERMDQRAALATAPVVLENHFAVQPVPTNGRRRTLPIFALFGWVAGCVLAALVEERKRLIAWLKQ
jgi:hypothetical protein